MTLKTRAILCTALATSALLALMAVAWAAQPQANKVSLDSPATLPADI